MAYKFESVLHVQELMMFKFLGCLVEEKNKCKDFACFNENLAKSKDWSGSRILISVPACLSVISQYFPVSTPRWMQEKSA
jgi:hypothetical protein